VLDGVSVAKPALAAVVVWKAAGITRDD